MITVVTVAIVCMQLVIGFTMIRAIRRQKKFHQHMVKARRFQMVALELFTEGDRKGGELSLAAAHEEVDRAQYYL